MDVMFPSDPVEAHILSMHESFFTRLNDPVTQSLFMSGAGLISFVLLGIQFVAPHAYAYAQLSFIHVAIRAGLCLALVSYVYAQLKSGKGGKQQQTAETTPAAAAAATETVASAAAVNAVNPTTTATANDGAGDDDTPFPDYLRSNRTYFGESATYSFVPVPAVRRVQNLIYGALRRPRMVEGAWNFVKKSVAAAAAAAATTGGPAPTAAADTSDSKSDAAAAVAAVSYPEVVSVYALGDAVCGHKNIIHGGLTSALLDQTLGIASFLALPPNRTSFTANLNVNYRKPLPANTAVAIRAATTRIDGRKLYVSGRVESFEDPNLLFADATALFVMPQPK